MGKGPEQKVVDNIVKTINKLPMCRIEKNHGTPYGFQKLDLTGAINGYMIQIEVKAPGNKPTPKQFGTIKKWQSVGVTAGWTDNTEDALELIKPLLNEEQLKIWRDKR